MTVRTLTALGFAVASLALASCGGDDEAETSAATTSDADVTITADPDGALAYTETDVTAPAGDSELLFDNPASISHDVVVEDADGNEIARTDVISGKTAITQLSAAAGEYTFYCSVDSHREAGMEGTLTLAQ